MVDGSIWGAEVAGSSPVSPTAALQGALFSPPILCDGSPMLAGVGLLS